MSFVDRAIGIQHFLFDSVPRNVREVPPKPRKQNPWTKDGKPIVSKVKTDADVRQSV